MAGHSYNEISAIAKKRRDEAISKYYQIPVVDDSDLPINLVKYSLSLSFYSELELEIISASAKDILENTRDRKWTCVQVTQAFCKASALAQSLVTPTHLDSLERKLLLTSLRQIALQKFCIRKRSKEPITWTSTFSKMVARSGHYMASPFPLKTVSSPHHIHRHWAWRHLQTNL